MNCSRCGSVVADNAMVCPNCGNLLGGTATPPPYPPQGPPPSPYPSGTPVSGTYSRGAHPAGAYAPGAFGQGFPPPTPIADYLVWSIISTLCCCLPLGIAAIVCSMSCKNDIAMGRYESALKNSNTAFYCNLVSLIFGLILVGIQIAVAIVQAMSEQGRL